MLLHHDTLTGRVQPPCVTVDTCVSITSFVGAIPLTRVCPINDVTKYLKSSILNHIIIILYTKQTKGLVHVYIYIFIYIYKSSKKQKKKKKKQKHLFAPKSKANS